jgi:phosphonate transport system substrate-binding protein
MRLTVSKFLNTIFLILFVLFFLPCNVSASDEESITLQIHPYLPASELLDRFAPLTKYLSKKIKIKIVSNISKDYRNHIDMVGQDRVDVAYMGPASYVLMTQKYGRKHVLSRLEINGSPLFQGVIVTRNNSSIQTLKDLAGKSFAFGDPNSTMSYLVPLYMLQKAGIRKDTLASHTFLSSHQNVAFSVLMGDFDAGAVKEEVFYQFKERGLKGLTWTPKISEHVFVTRSTLPSETVNILRNAMLTLSDKSILSSIKKGATALVSADDSDYNNLRSIMLSLEQTD